MKFLKTFKILDEIFDLVLVADYMDESLVLLADLLCASMDEVASLRINKRDQDNLKEETAKRISDKARRWNKADAVLFDYFNKTLWKKVDEYGYEQMSLKIKELHKHVDNLKSKCIVSDREIKYKDLKNVTWNNEYQPKGVAVTSYQLKYGAEKKQSCVRLVWPESVATKFVESYQAERARLATNSTK